MNKLRINLKSNQDNSYDVIIGRGLALAKLLPKAARYMVITDSKVKKFYAGRLARSLKAELLFFSAGEKSKNRISKAKLEDQMTKLGCGRDTTIIALGGGVVGDLAGFVAATYMRGIPYVQIPTTLLAMVDSSVGGKTAIDTLQGKNLIGAFWQPKKVIIDLDYLDTLPQEHLINGLIEAIKIFLTHDQQMFGYVEKNLAKILKKDKAVLQKIVERAIKIKAGVVERDEREKNERMVLNFGHTIGHAIEKLSGYKLLHGQSVALGILVEAKMARVLNVLAEDCYKRIEQLIKRLEINDGILKRYKVDSILEMLKIDKKSERGEARFVMLKDIGQVEVKNGSYVQKINNRVVKLVFLTN